MPTTKSGEKITWKEFGHRWKQGIENLTPLQTAKSSLSGYFPIMIGIIWGIVFTAYLAQWWLFLVLLGSFIVSGTQFMGMYQKYLALKKIDLLMKGGLDNGV